MQLAPSWAARAACANEPALRGYWDPGAPAWQHDVARAVCGRCPVQAVCLAYGLATGSLGVWGGAVLRSSGVDGRVRMQV